jgi:acyl-CoA thioester hydrolase
VSIAEKKKFYYPIKVRFVETDAQGHVFFGHYLTYFDIGLTEYMHAIGFSYQDLLAMGLDMFYVASDCQYHGRAYFDEVLHVHTCIGEIGNSSFTFQFAIYEKESDRLVTTGQIVAVVVDPETQKPVRVPEELRQAVREYEG